MNSSKNMDIADAVSTPSMGKICRLFGADITIDRHSDHKSTTSSNEIHDMVTHVDEEMKKQQNFMLFGVCIYQYHHDSCDVTSVILEEAANSDVAPPPPPPPPPIILGEKVLLFEKKLTVSDVCSGQNRLLIPKGDRTRLMADLTDEEKEKVLINKTDFLSVLTTDRDGVEYTLHLNMWTSSSAIVLTHQWRKLVAANGLKEGDRVQVWGYRVQPHDLRLQIIKKFN